MGRLAWRSAAALVVGMAMTASHAPAAENAPNAEGSRFTVTIDAPKPIAGILEKGLDLVRWAASKTRVTAPLLDRLVAEARTATRDALAAEGYFSPAVRAEIRRGEPVHVVIHVQPGPRTTVSAVDLRFRGAASAQKTAGAEQIDTIRREWSLKAGQPFTQAAWEEAKRKALTELASGRYAAARIASSEARIDPPTHTARLDVAFDSGPEYRAGEIEVVGLKRYPPRIVEDMSPFAPGEPYDATKLKIYQRRLLESGYFSMARLDVDAAAPPEHAPMRVSVIESQSQHIETGVSLSTDAGPGLQLDYGNSDVFGSAWRFHSGLKVDAKTQKMEASFDTPPYPGGSWNTYNTKLERTDIQNQVTRAAMIGGAHNFGLERTPSQVALSAHYEQKQIAGFGTESLHALFLNYRKTFRHTDDLLAPRRGVLGTLELGTSIPGASTQEFVRGIVRATFFVPAGERADLTARAQIGTVLADSRIGVPSTFLFRTGGDQTVRGYAFESIGVKQGDAIVGGRYLALGSLEYTYWIRGDWGAAVFVDAGDAFDQRSDFNPAVGYGIGARWRSPIGPLRADIAYGERTNQLRLHFSAGFTF